MLVAQVALNVGVVHRLERLKGACHVGLLDCAGQLSGINPCTRQQIVTVSAHVQHGRHVRACVRRRIAAADVFTHELAALTLDLVNTQLDGR